MPLTETPEIIQRPEMHYLFVEKTGAFMLNAPAAWQQAHKSIPEISKSCQITGYMSLYKTGPQIYRAGVSIAEPPVEIPEGFRNEKVPGGQYARFALIGSYAQLPQASGRAWEIFKESQFELRDAYAVENYVNDPRITPEDELVTNILIPCV